MKNPRIARGESALFEKVGASLSEVGFRSEKKTRLYVRGFEQGTSAVHLSFIERADDFDVTVDVAQRFEAVEKLVNAANPLMKESDKARTFTLGAELGNIESGKPRRWTVRDPEDVAHVALELKQAIVTVGFPYLKRYGSLTEALSLLSSDEPAAWVHSPIHAKRAKSAVAIAKILHSDHLDELIEKKRRYLESIGDPMRSSYERFVEYVRSLG